MPTRADASASALPAALHEPLPELRQERARRSYQALLDAAERLIAEDGYDAMGTPEIAAEAEVAVGTFYRYFTDKQQITLEVVRRYLRQTYHRTMDRLTPEAFLGRARRDTIEETVAILFRCMGRPPGLGRALIELSLRDPAVAALRAELETAAWQRLIQLIEAACPEAVIPDAAAAAWVLQAAVLECATSAAAGRGAAGRARKAIRPALPAARLRAALALMIERLFFPDAGAAPARSPSPPRR